MLYRPRQANKMWDTWLYYYDGVHYLYHLHMLTGPGDGITVATSTDGVHFDEVGPVILKRDGADWLGTGSVWPIGDRFIMNFSEIRNGVQAVFFAESPDLIHWERLGDEYRCDPDPRWYDDTPTGRWDCISMLPRSEGAGFVGYLTARPWPQTPGLSYESMGKVESEDGLHWHAVAPPVFEWGDWPKMNVHEPVGLERIGDRYYVLMGLGRANHLGDRHAWDSLGSASGMYTFVAEDLDGPFSPDTEAYGHLVSNNTWHRTTPERFQTTAWCSRFYRVPGEVLVHHHSVTRSDVRWFAPLKKAVVDDEWHLRLGYWQGNEAVKGKKIEVDLTSSTRVYPLQGEPDCRRHPTDCVSDAIAEPDRLEVDEPHSGGLMLLGNHFDTQRGVILEGTFEIDSPPKRWSGIGLFVEERLDWGGATRGTAILAETRGRTEIGVLMQGRGFVPDDAVRLGITPGERCRFNLLLRGSLLEFYLNDLLVQCYSIAEQTTGRLGLVFESGRATFENLRAWEMNL